MAYPFPPLRETLEAALNKPKTISLPIQGPPADMSSPEAAPWHNALLPEFDHTKVKLPNPIVARPRPDARFGAPPTPNKQRFDPRDAPIYMPPDGFGLNPSFGVKAKPNSKPAAPFGPFIEGPPKPSPEVPYDCDPGIRSDSPGDNFDCDPGISYKGPDDPYDWDPDISVGTPNRKPPALPFGVPAKPKSASPFDNLVLPQNLGPRNSLPIRRGQPSARDPYDCDPGFYPKGSGDNGYDCDPGFYPKGSGDNGYDCDPGMTPKISHSMPPFNPSELFGKPQPTANAGPAFHTWEDRQPWPPSNRTGPNFQTMEDRHLWRPSKDAEPNVHTLEDRRAFQPRSDTGPNVHTLEDNYPRKAPEDNNVVLSPSIFENADLATLQQHSQRQLDNDAGRIRFKEHLIQRQHYLLEEAKQAHADSWAKLKAGGIPGPKVAEALWDHNYKKHDVISRQYDLDWSQYELTEAKAKYDALDTWHRTTFAAPEQPPAAQERTPLTAPIAPEGQPPEGPANTHVATLSDKVPAPQDPHTTGNQSPSQPDSSLPPPDQTPFATGEEPNPAAQEGAPTTPPAPGATPIPEPEPGTGEALDRLLGTPGPRSAKGMVDAIQDWRTAAIERSAKLYQDSDPKRYIAEADAIDRRAKVALAQHAQQHVRHSVASQSAAPGGLMTLKTGLEKAGMNPDKLEPSLKASFDAYQKAVADPSLRVPRHSPVTPINVNGTPVAWVSTQEQRNGITDVRLMVADKEAEAKGKTDVKPISIRLPSVTDDDINKRKAELDQKFQDAIAQQNGVLDDEKKQDNAPFSIKGMFTPDTNFVAAKEKAAAEVVKARVACEQFEQNGKDILFKERLTEELKKDKYNGAIGEQSYGNSVILGLADAGTAALAIPARVADAYNGDDIG